MTAYSSGEKVARYGINTHSGILDIQNYNSALENFNNTRLENNNDPTSVITEKSQGRKFNNSVKTPYEKICHHCSAFCRNLRIKKGD